MTKPQIETYRLKLLRLLERVRPDALSVEEQARVSSGGEAAGGISNAPLHLGDLGTAALSQELGGVVLENEQRLLQEMHDALARLDDGSFGRCELCGDEIEKRRLTSIPYARCCRQCAEQDEDETARVNLNSGRPKWETETIAADDKLIEQRDSADGADDFTDHRPSGRSRLNSEDAHAAGTPGGGTEIGGLAGTNIGRGDPNPDDLAKVMGSGQFDPTETGDREVIALAGPAGGAVGGTPAGKRSRPNATRSKASQT